MIQDARAKLGLSRSEFAHLLGVSSRTVESWEQGLRAPSGSAEILIKISLHHPELVKKFSHLKTLAD